MRRKKEDYIVMVFAGILLLIVGVIVFLLLSPNETPQSNIPQKNTPQQTSETTDNPPVLYNETAQEKLLEKLDNRAPLSTDDSFAKAKILALLPSGEASGILFQSQNISIDYTASADQFQVEILTTNIAQAKAEANVWFRSHGMSQEGICDYPVNFYLNWDIAEQLRGKNIEFSPLPNGC